MAVRGVRYRSGGLPVWARWAAWLLAAGATAFWAWGILALSLDEGFTWPATALLVMLGLTAVGLAWSWRRTVGGAGLLVLASLGIGAVMLVAALGAPPESRPVLLVVALLFPLPWLGAGIILLVDAVQARRASS
jgi:hypothetical protein